MRFFNPGRLALRVSNARSLSLSSRRDAALSARNVRASTEIVGRLARTVSTEPPSSGRWVTRPTATASANVNSIPVVVHSRALSSPTRTASRRVPNTRPNPAPGNRNRHSAGAIRTSQAVKRSAPAPHVRPEPMATVRSRVPQSMLSSVSIRTKRCSKSPSLCCSMLSRSNPVQKCRPTPRRTTVSRLISDSAAASDSIRASTSAADKALPRCGRLSLISIVESDKVT